MADIIRQIKVGSTDYDIHAYDRYIDEKTYTGLIGTENNWKNGSYYFLTVIPTDWNAEWTVKYRLEVTLDNGVTSSNYQYYRSNHECLVSGTRGVYTAYSFFNSISSTSYRTIYYHVNHNTTSAGFTAGQGHKIGISFQSAANPTSTSYKRTIRVILEQAINCTAILAANNAALEIPASSGRTGYTKLNSTYFTESNSNSAGNYNLLDAYSNGLRETGDDNTTTQLNLYLNYLKNATTYEDGSAGYLLGYTLFGLDKDGKAMAFSKKTPTQTAYNADPSTTRVYCNKGFDYTKGVFYINSSGNFAANADLNVSPLKFQTAVDLRYTDNCVASTSATTLGIVYREPVYLRGTIGSDGLFYIDPITVTYSSNSYKRAWVQPSDTSAFDTSHVYWFIGYGYYNSSYTAKAYQLDLHSSDSLMKWDGSKLIPYVPSSDTNQTVKGNGTTFGANAAVDIVGGGNVTVTGDSTNNKITVSYTQPGSLKNPNAIHVYGETTKVLEYDGSAAKSLYIKSSTTAGAFTVSDGTSSKLIQLAGDFTNTHYTSTWSVYAGATCVSTFNQSANRSITFSAGDNVTLTGTAGGGVITISGTGDTHYTSTFSIYAGTVCASTFNQSANRSIKFSAGSNITLDATTNGGVITISGPTNILNLESFSGASSQYQAYASLVTVADSDDSAATAYLNLRQVTPDSELSTLVTPYGVYYDEQNCTTAWPRTYGTFATQEFVRTGLDTMQMTSISGNRSAAVQIGVDFDYPRVDVCETTNISSHWWTGITIEASNFVYTRVTSIPSTTFQNVFRFPNISGENEYTIATQEWVSTVLPQIIDLRS